MLALKGRYDGTAVVLNKRPLIPAGDVIVTFLDSPTLEKTADDGSLAYLFRDYIDDGLREPLIDFGESIGNEQW